MPERRETQDQAEAVESRRQAAQQTDALGPGTAGFTISGAAYRGMEVAADTGNPSPADPGFPVTRVGLHPGQGTDGDHTYEAAADTRDQTVNEAARLPDEQLQPTAFSSHDFPAHNGRIVGGLSAVEMLTSPVEGETPENRE